MVTRSDPLAMCGVVGDAWTKKVEMKKNAFGDQSSLP